MATRRTKTSATKRTQSKTAAPWNQENPKDKEHKHLSPQAKAAAQRRAKQAGRTYPNLVDNMRAAKAKK